MGEADCAERGFALTPIVLRRVRVRRPSPAAAENARRRACLELLRNPAAVRDHQRPAGWLGTTARRPALRALARRARAPRAVPRWSAPSPERALIIAERDGPLWQVVDTRPDRSRA